MVIRLNIDMSDFVDVFDALLSIRQVQDDEIDRCVSDIIMDVRLRGDIALRELTQKFDYFDLDVAGWRISDTEIADAEKSCDTDILRALDKATERITQWHLRQKPKDDFFTDDVGCSLGNYWHAVQTAGLYVPGGTASYPSSVLMSALPAKVAGVERIIMTVPTPHNIVNPLVLVAAQRAGVDEIYRIGGAQAIAALAYGTERIQSVDVIVGPGNAYVATAKKQVFGHVGIDMIAGPSEILIVADNQNNPAWIAADLLAQAEHDIKARSILICDDTHFADAVCEAVEQQLKTLPRSEIARVSWHHLGAIILVPHLMDDRVMTLIDQLASEHVELAIDHPENLACKIKNAGAIFLGRYTPEAIGDYIAGPSHVLPTSRTARYASGLSVLNFMKRTSLVGCDAMSLKKLGPYAIQLAQAEGLEAHARSISKRLQKNDG